MSKEFTTNNGNKAVITKELKNNSFLCYCKKYNSYFILSNLDKITLQNKAFQKESDYFVKTLKKALEFKKNEDKKKALYSDIKPFIIKAIKLVGDSKATGQYELLIDGRLYKVVNNELVKCDRCTIYTLKNREMYPVGIDEEGYMKIINDLLPLL